MKLTKKHIGKLVDNEADGSWVYQLVDIKNGWLLFYCFGGCKYVKEKADTYSDWKIFKPRKPWPKDWLDYGWAVAKE